MEKEDRVAAVMLAYRESTNMAAEEIAKKGSMDAPFYAWITGVILGSEYPEYAKQLLASLPEHHRILAIQVVDSEVKMRPL